MSTPPRLDFMDNLRIALVAMVIVHHAGQAYGPTGEGWPVFDPDPSRFLGPFFTVNRSFGLSLFFLVAGYFMVQACDRYGPRVFASKRLKRLGLPLAVFTVFVMVMQVFVLRTDAEGDGLGSPWPVNVWHLWFVQHLLLFSLIYAGWRALRPGRVGPEPRRVPGVWVTLAFVVGLTFASAIVRTWFFIDQWFYLLGFLRVMPADVPRDLGMFVVGAFACRHDWVLRYPSRTGRVWLAVGVSLAVLWAVYSLVIFPAINIDDVAFGLVYPLWESLLCVAFCIGLVTLFRDRWNTRGVLARELAASTYAAYIGHLFVVVAVQAALTGLDAPALLKFLIVAVVCVPLTFALASVVRRPLRL